LTACTFGIRLFAEFSRTSSARSPASRHLYDLRLRWEAAFFSKGLRSPADIFRYVVDELIVTDKRL